MCCVFNACRVMCPCVPVRGVCARVSERAHAMPFTRPAKLVLTDRSTPRTRLRTVSCAPCDDTLARLVLGPQPEDGARCPDGHTGLADTGTAARSRSAPPAGTRAEHKKNEYEKVSLEVATSGPRQNDGHKNGSFPSHLHARSHNNSATSRPPQARPASTHGRACCGMII